MTRLRMLGGLLAVVLLAAACDGDDVGLPGAPTDPVADTVSPTPSTVPVDTSAPSETTAPPDPTAAPTTSAAAPATSVAPVVSTSAAAPLLPATEPTGSVEHGTITVDGLERTYRLYVPASLPGTPVPLFVGLHGGTGWGDQFATTDHIEGLAESNGFLVVHPDGVKVLGGRGGVWNGGVCCGRAARDGIDDVAFITALVDRLAATYAVDDRRVFAFGHSNGGIMSYRLACEAADRIVGIGVVAGTLGIDTCAPTQPVSGLHVHGDADTNLPLAGGVGADGISGVDFPPPLEGFGRLADALECGAPATTVEGDLTTELRSPCRGGAELAFVTIATANHSWPGGTPIIPPVSGPGYADYDATAEIVAFLLAHPRP